MHTKSTIFPNHLQVIEHFKSILGPYVSKIKQVEKPADLRCATIREPVLSYYVNNQGQIEGMRLNLHDDGKLLSKLMPSLNEISGSFKSLYLENIYIKDLNIFSELKNLEILKIVNYPDNWISAMVEYSKGESRRKGLISELKPLTKLNNLRELTLRGQQITDLSPLSSLKGLVHLDVGYNHFKDIEPLGELVNLESLSICINRKIKDFRPLAKLTNLKSLLLTSTSIGKYPDQMSLIFPNLTNLKYLKLSYAMVENVEPLAHLENLEKLDLARNPVSDIEPLKGLKKLRDLNLSGTKVDPVPDWVPAEKAAQ